MKAVLYDLDLRPLAEARREKPLSHPRPGWVEQDAEAGAGGGRRRGRRAARPDADAEVVACGLDHQGESVLAWDAESGRPLTPIVTWQDKRSQEVLDRLEPIRDARRRSSASGLPLDPYFSAGKLTWLLEHDEAWSPRATAGTLRLGTVDSFLCDRLGAGFATDPSTASRTQLGAPEWNPALLEIFGVPAATLPAIEDTVGDLGALAASESGPSSCRCAPAASTSRRRSRGRAASTPASPRRPTAPASSSSRTPASERPSPAGGLLPTIAWRVGGQVEWALDGGVFTAGALLDWLSRDLGLAADPAALAAAAAEVEDSGGVRILPALSGVGAPWWRPDARAVVAGASGQTRPGHLARAALEAIAWRVADVLGSMRETVAIEALRVDGGLTRSELLLTLQADTAGVPVERGAVDATAAGSAALAAVGAGLWDSTLEIGERIPVGERIEPTRDAAFRDPAHAEWRRFVERAAEL